MDTPERRFNEAEVAKILERATTHDEPAIQPPSSPSSQGLTLVQLQDIGKEIGIAPDVIARSAAMLDVSEGARIRRPFGLPLRVEQRVALPRKLSDEEWERVVVELREVFDARGSVKREGSLRQWTNGNLQALLEPTSSGQRLRIRTFKGNAPALIGAGLGAFGVGAAGIVAAVMRGAAAAPGITGMAIVAAAGATLLTVTTVGLVPWARKRRAQMEELAARVAAMSAEPSDETLTGGSLK